MATTHENPMGSHGKPPKSGSTRRKISLPWFRQASIGEKLTRLRLPRQNTVDCPSSRPSSSAERLNNIRRKVMSSSSSVEVEQPVVYCLELSTKAKDRRSILSSVKQKEMLNVSLIKSTASNHSLLASFLPQQPSTRHRSIIVNVQVDHNTTQASIHIPIPQISDSRVILH